MDDKTVVRFPNDNTIVKPRPGGKRFIHSEQSSLRKSTDTSFIYDSEKDKTQIDRNVRYDSLSDLSRASDAKNISYFDTNHNGNNIIHSASIVLSIMIKLTNSTFYNDLDNLKNKLQEVIKDFEMQCSHNNVDIETIFKSRYVICTVLDEIISYSSWGQDGSWSQHSLLSIFHGETWGGEKFFVLLDRLLKEPAKNIDLLELMYICISLGFQGKFKVLDNGFSEIESLRDNLFRHIRNQRSDFKRELSSSWRTPSKNLSPLIRYVPLWVVGAISGVILLSLFATFSFFLNQSSGSILYKVNELSSNNRNAHLQQNINEPIIPLINYGRYDLNSYFKNNKNEIKFEHHLFGHNKWNRT